jgi:hypothetical protein
VGSTAQHGQQPGVVKKQTGAGARMRHRRRNTNGRCCCNPTIAVSERDECRAGSRLLVGSERRNVAAKRQLVSKLCSHAFLANITHHPSRTQAIALSPRVSLSRGRSEKRGQGLDPQVKSWRKEREVAQDPLFPLVPSSHLAYPAPGPSSAFAEGTKTACQTMKGKFWFLWVKSDCVRSTGYGILTAI